MQVVNCNLDAICELQTIKSVLSLYQACCKLTFADLMQLVSSTCIKSANVNLQQVCFQQACCKLMTSTSLLQLVDNLQQAGKIRNLQQVCGVSGCVFIT
jgi:hypothetical protein